MQTLYQSPRDPDFFQNPFVFYKKIRNAGKIVWWKEYNMVVTPDYNLVNNILRDKTFVREPPSGFFSNVPDHLKPFYENEARSMLEREPPYHTKLKALTSPFFTNRKLKQLKKEMEFSCNNLLEKISAPEFDLISSFAQKFPVTIIARMLGVPESMAPQLVRWSNDMVAMYQARRDETIERKAVEAINEFSEYIKDLLKQKKLSSSDDLISYLSQTNTAKDPINEEEIISTIILLLNAGHEATVHTISNGVKTILESSFKFVDLLKDPKRLVEEVLRYATPLHMFTRYSTTEIIICGHQFATGEKIGLLLGAANRDPAHFEAPDVFNPFIDRKVNLSLGAGIHFCLGAHLARLELEIALTTLIKRFPNLKISSMPIFQDKYHFFGLKELILKTYT